MCDAFGVRCVRYTDASRRQNQLPTSSQPGALSNRSSQSPVASPPSALADEFGFSRACDEEGGDDDDDDTIRPKRRERTFSSAATIFPDANTMSGSPHTNDARSAGMLFDDDPFRRLDEEDECTPERPPSRCGFLDDEDEGDEPPQYVGGAALARYN